MVRDLPRTLGAILVVILLAAVAISYAGKQFVMPEARSAQSYPAHDTHPNEKIAIAADPYDTGDKDVIFTQDYSDYGYLPIFVVVTNDSDEPIALQNLHLEFVTYSRSKIQPATLDDLYRRFSRVVHRGDEPRTNPLPFPKKGTQAGVNQHARDEFQAAMFQARAVEPHSSQAGFFFFDIQGISQPLAGAHLYLTGIRDNNAQDLMYFEIPMEKYLSAVK